MTINQFTDFLYNLKTRLFKYKTFEILRIQLGNTQFHYLTLRKN